MNALLAQTVAQATQAAPAADATLESAGAASSASSALPQLPLWGEYALGDPHFLALLPLALCALWWGARPAARAAYAASAPGAASADGSAAYPRSWRQRIAWLPRALSGAALVLALLALARPVRGNVQIERTSEGVDIALVVDRSGSMSLQDLAPGVTRFDVVREVVGEFARSRMSGSAGAADNVGLITFARFPQLVCPFTLDADALLGFLAQLEIVKNQSEDGTAIGAGLAKAVALLRTSDAKSRVAVLLTDGENTESEIPPLEAARLAREAGVRVHTVLAGRYVYERDIFQRVIATERELDASELQEIARTTGGRFFRARDRAGLEQVYAQIEQLERTPRQERRHVETHDLYPWLLAPALALHVLASLLRAGPALRLP